jgi:hypothetical protein
VFFLFIFSIINLFSFLCRSTLQYTSSQTPFLPTRNNLIQKSSVAAGGARSPHGFSEKNFKKCSWRCIAIFFVVLAVILSAALAYITGKFLISQYFICFLKTMIFFTSVIFYHHLLLQECEKLLSTLYLEKPLCKSFVIDHN